MDATLVDRRQEGTDGPCLGHASDLGDIGSVVAVLSVSRMIDDQQVAVAPLCPVLRHPLAVAVARVAVQAGLADVGGAEAVEGGLKLRDVTLKELFAAIECLGESHLGHGGRLVLITTLGDIHRRSLLSADEPFLGSEVTHGFSDVVGLDDGSVVTALLVIVCTRSHGRPSDEGCHDQEMIMSLVHHSVMDFN